MKQNDHRQSPVAQGVLIQQSTARFSQALWTLSARYLPFSSTNHTRAITRDSWLCRAQTAPWRRRRSPAPNNHNKSSIWPCSGAGVANLRVRARSSIPVFASEVGQASAKRSTAVANKVALPDPPAVVRSPDLVSECQRESYIHPHRRHNGRLLHSTILQEPYQSQPTNRLQGKIYQIETTDAELFCETCSLFYNLDIAASDDNLLAVL